MLKDKADKKSHLTRFKEWFLKPKSLNATVCWIFTLAAAVPLITFCILGESGVMVGGFLGGGFLVCGLLVALITMD